jgi:pimeloyl-ACP methyl ester carboxylesterase
MKPALVLLHGALGSASHWQATKTLLENDYTVYTPDFPGHGMSALSAHSQIINLVDYLVSYLEEHQLHEPFIAGYSMGGYVALMAVLRRDLKLSKLVCLATKMHWSPLIADEEASKLNPQILQTILPKLEAEHGPNFPALLDSTASILRTIGAHPLSVSEMEKLNTTCVFIRGEKDKMVSAEENLQFREASKHVTYIEMPAQGHLLEKMDAPTVANLFKQVFQ